MTPEQLRLSGLLLYGKQWKGVLAQNLGITPSALWRIVNGKSKVMVKHEKKINELLEAHDRLIRATLRNAHKEKRTEISA
jgi:hypothetical protein